MLRKSRIRLFRRSAFLVLACCPAVAILIIIAYSFLRPIGNVMSLGHKHLLYFLIERDRAEICWMAVTNSAAVDAERRELKYRLQLPERQLTHHFYFGFFWRIPYQRTLDDRFGTPQELAYTRFRTGICAPLWSLLLLFASYPTVTLLSGPVRRFRRRRRSQCLECSYNLTGNTSGICPECGTPCKAREVRSPQACEDQ